MLGVASQLSKLWRNDRGSTGNQKTFKRDSGVFCIWLKFDYRNLEADVTSCVNGVTGIEFCV